MYFNRFDICEAYYLFFSDYHSGMFSEFYRRLSTMGEYFKPSPLLCYENMTENGQMIYDNLVDSLNDETRLEDVIDFGKGRLTSANDQPSTWYQGPQ